MLASSSGIIIQARMGSSRLPEKVLLPFYNQKSILQLLVERLLTYNKNLPIVIATSYQSEDDPIADLAFKLRVPIFRGEEYDVLKRFIECAGNFGFKQIIRVCADNPFLDLDLLDKLINISQGENLDYSSYQLCDNLPAIRSHWGIFAEYTTLEALNKVSIATPDAFYHEHVTNFIYSHPDLFNLKWLNAPQNVYDRLDIRLTIDTSEDFISMQRLYAFLVESKKVITFENILHVLTLFPEIQRSMQAQIGRFQK
jgi:spore coat polysaccharide biosynthesis protein SpsF